MEHVAIDLGGRESQICVRSATGEVLEERRIGSDQLETYLSKRPPSRVVVETCAEAFTVADAVRRTGHEVRVVPSVLVPALGVGSRQTKTDRRDARILSEVSTRIDLPSVHVPSETSRRRRAMCTMRDALVSSRTQLINSVRGWMRTVGLRVRASRANLVEVLQDKHAEALPTYVKRQMRVIGELDAQILEADQELRAEAKADETCRRLMTVPGIGPVTAVQFVATLDTVQRFEGAHRVQSYLGLTPGERSSSDRQQRTGITKAGNPAMRRLLVQAAWAARRSRRAGPLLEWTTEIEKRRGKFVATVASRASSPESHTRSGGTAPTTTRTITPRERRRCSATAAQRRCRQDSELRLSREGDRDRLREAPTSFRRWRPLDGLQPMRLRARILD